MPVFVADDKQVISLQIKIFMQFRRNQTLKQFPVAFGIAAHTHLTVISIAATAAGFNCQFVVVGQILRRGNGAAALGIISGQGNNINVNHGLFQFTGVGNRLMILSGIRH